MPNRLRKLTVVEWTFVASALAGTIFIIGLAGTVNGVTGWVIPPLWWVIIGLAGFIGSQILRDWKQDSRLHEIGELLEHPVNESRLSRKQARKIAVLTSEIQDINLVLLGVIGRIGTEQRDFLLAQKEVLLAGGKADEEFESKVLREANSEELPDLQARLPGIAARCLEYGLAEIHWPSPATYEALHKLSDQLTRYSARLYERVKD